MTPDIYDRADRAFSLASALHSTVAHFGAFLDALYDGDMVEAHWELYMGGWVPTAPEADEL